MSLNVYKTKPIPKLALSYYLKQMMSFKSYFKTEESVYYLLSSYC